MFSLIITIISIALVAALAVATIYYGGDAFNQGSTKAKASTIVNQAQQIAGANTLLKAATGSFSATGVAGLVSTYLAAAPSSSADITAYAVDTNNVVTGTVDKDDVCKKINDVANGTTSGAYSATSQFGCDTATKVFSFKG